MPEFTADMSELSGFGGSYEERCRAMMLAGYAWLVAHPDADLKPIPGQGNTGVQADSKDYCALDAAILAECPDCTGAMHGAAMNHAIFAWKNGWDKYAAESRERYAAEHPVDALAQAHAHV